MEITFMVYAPNSGLPSRGFIVSDAAAARRMFCALHGLKRCPKGTITWPAPPSIPELAAHVAAVHKSQRENGERA